MAIGEGESLSQTAGNCTAMTFNPERNGSLLRRAPEDLAGGGRITPANFYSADNRPRIVFCTVGSSAVAEPFIFQPIHEAPYDSEAL